MRAIREAADEKDTTDSGAHTSVYAHIANKQFHFHLAVHSKSILILFPFFFFFPEQTEPRPRQTGSRNRGPARIPPRSPDRVLNCTNLTFTFHRDAISAPPQPPPLCHKVVVTFIRAGEAVAVAASSGFFGRGLPSFLLLHLVPEGGLKVQTLPKITQNSLF